MRKKNKKITVFVLVLVIGFVIGVLCLFYYQVQPVGDGSKQVIITIKEGESFDSVLEQMENKKIIRSKAVAKLVSKFSGHCMHYAGDFILNDGMGLSDALSHIGSIENTKKNQVTVTIPEGKWAKDIASILSKLFPYSQDEFIAQWNDSDYLKKLSEDYEFLDSKDLENPNYKIKLEGYLFPETYSINENASIDEITRTFLDQFDLYYQANKKEIEMNSINVHDLVTLASVVQFEAAQIDDMKIISGVFYNRLEQGMKLESSVTVCYALYDDFNDPMDCEVKTDIDSPYNTYKYGGLPVGPILNPGKDALNAVIHPKKSDYLYFVADIHGDGKVYYSKTYDEHMKKAKELGLLIK